MACALRRGWGGRARARSSHRELQPGGLQGSDPKAERFCPQGDRRQSPQGHPPLCPGEGMATGMDTGTQREAAWPAVLHGTPVAKPRLPHVPGARLCLQPSAPPRAAGLDGPTARRGPAACQSLRPPHPHPPGRPGAQASLVPTGSLWPRPGPHLPWTFLLCPPTGRGHPGVL